MTTLAQPAVPDRISAIGRRAAVKTLGCKINVYESNVISQRLTSDHWTIVDPSQEADLYVINSCTVTREADRQTRQEIRRVVRRNPSAKVVVTGCYAQRAPDELAEIAGVSLIVGAADRARIVEELDATAPGQTRVAVSSVAEAVKFLEVPITEMMERSRAYVKVQEGCNEACTFCIVPQTRGVSRSREMPKVVDQVSHLVNLLLIPVSVR